MAKIKIEKNRSIADMMRGSDETDTFETMVWEDDDTPKPKVVKKEVRKETLEAGFFDVDLQEKVGKILLDIKMQYYKEGVVDYSLEVVKDGKNVVIKTAPKTGKPKNKG